MGGVGSGEVGGWVGEVGGKRCFVSEAGVIEICLIQCLCSETFTKNLL